MNEVNWALYIREIHRAEELYAVLKMVAKDEGWITGIPDDLIDNERLFMRAKIAGLITSEEYTLLKRRYL